MSLPHTAVQAVLFDKQSWDSKSAKAWLKEHNYKPIKRVHVTKNFRRYRLSPPERGASYATKSVGNGVSLVIRTGMRGGNQSKTLDSLPQVEGNSRYNSGIWNWTSTYDYPPYSYEVPLSALDAVREAALPAPKTVINISHGDSNPTSSAIAANSMLPADFVNSVGDVAETVSPNPNLSGAGWTRDYLDEAKRIGISNRVNVRDMARPRFVGGSFVDPLPAFMRPHSVIGMMRAIKGGARPPSSSVRFELPVQRPIVGMGPRDVSGTDDRGLRPYAVFH